MWVGQDGEAEQGSNRCERREGRGGRKARNTGRRKKGEKQSKEETRACLCCLQSPPPLTVQGSPRADNGGKRIGPTNYPFGPQMICLFAAGQYQLPLLSGIPMKGTELPISGTQSLPSDMPILQGSVEDHFLWEDSYDIVSS